MAHELHVTVHLSLLNKQSPLDSINEADRELNNIVDILDRGDQGLLQAAKVCIKRRWKASVVGYLRC